MVIIYQKGGGDVEAVWSGTINTLETIYPNNQEILNYFDQLILESEIQEVLNNPWNYRVENGQIIKK